jgi:cyclophilin family peptidyl-prolyl cis-trans isomerase
MFFSLKKELKEYEYTPQELDTFQYAVIKTNKGVINLKLFVDEVPNTVSNFVHLTKDGFYDDLNFHRVIPGFMAQGGCPNGTGTGGPDWAIACETDKNTHNHIKGTLSMAHAGPNTGGSQFFICFAPQPHLDGVHTVFGQIPEEDGASFIVLDSIEQSDKIESITIVDSLEDKEA